jgi:hypothetical protein
MADLTARALEVISDALFVPASLIVQIGLTVILMN